MNSAGIDKTVILALDYEFLFRGQIIFQEYNERVADKVNKFPDWLIGFTGIVLNLVKKKKIMGKNAQKIFQ